MKDCRNPVCAGNVVDEDGMGTLMRMGGAAGGL